MPHSRLSTIATLRKAIRLSWSEADQATRRYLGAAAVLALLSAMFGATAPLALKYAIDAYSSGGPGSHVLAYIAVGALGYSASRLAAELRMYCHGIGEQHLQHYLSIRAFSHTIRLPLRFHALRQSSDTGQVLNNGLMGYQILAQHGMYTFLPTLVEILVVAVILWQMDEALYFAIICGVSLVHIAICLSGAADAMKPVHAIATAQTRAHARLSDPLLNIPMIKLFGAERPIVERLDAALRRTKQLWRHFFIRRTRNGIIAATISGFSFGVPLVLGGVELLQGSMMVGTYLLIFAYVHRLTWPMEQLGISVRELGQAIAYLGRFTALFDERPERLTSATGAEAVIAGDIALERVCFSYDGVRLALDNIDIHIAAGKTLAIVGESGSGKSTLAKLLVGYYAPISGRILIDGKPISAYPLPTLRRSISLIQQNTSLINDTIGYNIRLGNFAASRRQVEIAAERAQLGTLLRELPSGLSTRVQELGYALSAGERQRIGIARALLRDAPIWILDEVTSSLDPHNARAVEDALEETCKGRTRIVITHQLASIVDADEIIVLRNGHVVGCGSHSSLLDGCGYYAHLWQTQHGQAATAARSACA